MVHAKYKLITLIILSLSVRAEEQEPSNCVLEEFPKTMTFSSLEEYQASRTSFNPHHYGYEGNVVAFSFDKLEVIPRNAFISFGSEGIVELDLQNKQIERIDKGAFLELDCLNELNLSHNNITNLSEGVFDGLGRLKNLFLNNNNLEATPDSGMAFLHLKSLVILDLSRNRIKSLQRIAFDSLTNLKVLNLNHNHIRNLEDTVFNALVNLETLLLNYNYLTTIAPHRWKNLGNLNTLNLAENYITTFDIGFNFSFVNLTNLNFSGNYITSLDGIELKQTFIHLEYLDIGNNPWRCDDLNALRNSLVGSKINLPHGIKCSREKMNWSVPTPPPDGRNSAVVNSTVIYSDSAERNLSKQIHSEILKNDEKLLTKLEYIQHFLTCVTTIAVLIFFIVIILKLQICQVFCNSFRNRQSGYSEHVTSNGTESYSLIGG